MNRRSVLKGFGLGLAVPALMLVPKPKVEPESEFPIFAVDGARVVTITSDGTSWVELPSASANPGSTFTIRNGGSGEVIIKT